MSGFLLDTNCISELVRIRPDPNVIRWLEAANEQTLFLSVLSLGEIRKGIVTAPPNRQAHLHRWLNIELRRRFEGRILPIDAAVSERWGIVIAEAKQTGKTIPVIDSLIAATALHHNLTVVSRNVGDFQQAKVPIVNPWAL